MCYSYLKIIECIQPVENPELTSGSSAESKKGIGIQIISKLNVNKFLILKSDVSRQVILG